jgi:hypothetical protein
MLSVSPVPALQIFCLTRHLPSPLAIATTIAWDALTVSHHCLLTIAQAAGAPRRTSPNQLVTAWQSTDVDATAI